MKRSSCSGDKAGYFSVLDLFLFNMEMVWYSAAKIGPNSKHSTQGLYVILFG